MTVKEHREKKTQKYYDGRKTLNASNVDIINLALSNLVFYKKIILLLLLLYKGRFLLFIMELGFIPFCTYHPCDFIKKITGVIRGSLILVGELKVNWCF